MDIEKLVLAYSGSLDAYNPSDKHKSSGFWKHWFWTYRHHNVDPSTRSAYYIIEAVKILRDKHAVIPSELNIQLWGSINSLNEKQVKLSGLEDFFSISSYLPKQESLDRLKMADILFLPLEKSNTTKNRTLFIPGKLFEYLRSEKPILALCEESDCRDIIEKSGLGICCSPDNPGEIAETLLPYIRDKNLLKKFKADTAYISSFSFKNQTGKLAEIFNNL